VYSGSRAKEGFAALGYRPGNDGLLKRTATPCN